MHFFFLDFDCLQCTCSTLFKVAIGQSCYCKVQVERKIPAATILGKTIDKNAKLQTEHLNYWKILRADISAVHTIDQVLGTAATKDDDGSDAFNQLLSVVDTQQNVSTDSEDYLQQS